MSAEPNSVGHGSNATSPQTTQAVPSAVTPLSTCGTTRWCSGTGTTSRLSQTLSPSTPREAQLSIDGGRPKIRGLTHIHATDAAIASHDHAPNQSRLQTATTTSGSTEARVHTLQGFAWRNHVASSIDIAEASLRSRVKRNPLRHAWRRHPALFTPAKKTP